MSTHLVCPNCQAVNRLSERADGQRPTCGRCHHPLFTGKPLAVSASAFDLHLRRDELPLLVDFWAPWCGPCRTMEPAFEQAAGQLEPDFRLLKVDTEQEQGLAARYAIRSIPTLALFRGGREIARQAGAMGVNDIVRWAHDVA